MLTDGQTLFSRYQIVRRLGAGGMGAVYEALDTRLSAPVAVKENLFSDGGWQDAFRREAQFLANLSHPSLPRVIDHFFEGEVQYLVMEFIEGDALDALASKHGKPLPVADFMNWMRQLLGVLDYLHSQPVPIVHRDIKPSNIKVRGGRVFLLDFGLAYGHSGEMSTFVSNRFNWNGHSPNYSPPEQLRGEPTSPASDVYALAATLYMVLTATPPDHAGRRLEMLMLGKGDPLRNVGLHRPDLDKHVSQSIMRALSLDPTKRPQTAGEMLRMMFPVPAAKAKRRALHAAVAACLTMLTLTVGFAGGLSASGLETSFCQRSTEPIFKQILRCDARTEAPETNPAPPPAQPREQAERLTAEAEKLLQSGKYEEAVQRVREALGLVPNDAYVLSIYGDALWDMDDGGHSANESEGQKDKYQEIADRIISLVVAPGNASEFAARAWANLARGKFDVAIADATKALQLRPDCVPALMIRAAAKSSGQSGSKKALESLADYDEAIRLAPNYAQAYANRASTYMGLAQYRLAVSDYTEAIRLVPRARFHIALGYAYFSLGEYDSARKEYRAALKQSPTQPQAYLGLAEVCFQEEDWDNATSNYTLAIKMEPTSVAYNGRANVYAQMEQYEKAVQDFSKAIGLDPDDYKSYGGRADARAHLEEWHEAVGDYGKAIELAPQDDREYLGYIYRQRANAYMQVGQEALANADEKRARGLGR